jgi:cytosolic 5'-nucleotidase 3
MPLGQYKKDLPLKSTEVYNKYMENVKVPNQEIFELKLAALKKDGLASLHVIADFDHTLTKAKVSGQNPGSSFSQIRGGGYLSPEYVERANNLYAEYYPIEIDPNLSQEIKNQKMKEWWEQHLELLVEHGMNKAVFEDIIAKNKVQGRIGLKELLSFTYEEDVPLLIFSAGLGDLIKAYLEKEKVNFPNIHVISNLFEFDRAGMAVGIQNKIIHTFNKSEFEITNTPFAKEILARPNALLLGDSIGDAFMTADLKHSTVVKVGFLNGLTEWLPEFERHFDTILLGDDGLDYVIDLLRKIG